MDTSVDKCGLVVAHRAAEYGIRNRDKMAANGRIERQGIPSGPDVGALSYGLPDFIDDIGIVGSRASWENRSGGESIAVQAFAPSVDL